MDKVLAFRRHVLAGQQQLRRVYECGPVFADEGDPKGWVV